MKKGSVNQITQYLVVMVTFAIAFFLTRLISLTSIPIFTDEAIYLRWAQIALADPKWRFISLIDGKQPLLIWLFLPAVKVIDDPLVAGRLVSVLMGFAALTLLSGFCWYKTRSAVGAVLGATAYVLIPFFLVYDRLAIYEALFVFLAVAALFLSYLLGKYLRLDLALVLGAVIGFGLLTKSYATFFLLLLPGSLLLIPWVKKNKSGQFFRWLGLIIAVLIQAKIYEGILLLSEFRHVIGEKNLQFIYSFTEVLHNPLSHIWGNFIGLSGWLIAYLTIPLFLFCGAAFVWLIRRQWQEGFFFLSWFIVPFTALMVFGKVIYPRFLLFLLPPMLIPAVQLAKWLWEKYDKKKIAVLGLVIISPLVYFDLLLLINPIKAPLPYADRQQFINDWPAGYGIKEVVMFLEAESQNGPVVVGTDGTFGLFPMALELYLGTNKNVTVKAYWPLSEFPKELSVIATSEPVFLIFKERQDAPPDWPIQLIKAYQRGDGPTSLKFFRVLPQ